MKKLLCSAVALSLTSATGVASGDDWTDLDRAVEAMSASLANEAQGPEVHGYLIVNYLSSSDIEVGSSDLGGFALPNARLAVEGDQGGYRYRVQYDFADNKLKDAYARFPIAESINGMIGNYKSPVLTSGLTSRSKLFFLDRSAGGEFWGGRDLGFQLDGNFDANTVNWYISLQNGANDIESDYLFSARAQFNLIGEAFKRFGVEGAQDGKEDPSGMVAISMFDDGSVDEGDGFAGEVYFKSSVYSFGAEVLDLGDGASGSQDAEGDRLNGFVDDYYSFGSFAGISLEDNSNPFAVEGTYMISATEGNTTGWEVGGRYQDFDDSDNTSMIEVGVRRYLVGHKLKWGLFFITTDSDNSGKEFDLLGADLVVAF